MTPDQREAEIRRRDARFRRMEVEDRVMLSAQVYGHLADCSFLLGVIDGLRRVIAHAPTAPLLPTVTDPMQGASLPKPPAIPSPWDEPENQV